MAGVDRGAIAGTVLWALALYLGFSPLAQWVIDQINRGLNFAERSLYASEDEFERARPGWDAPNALLASLVSVGPFLGAGGLCNYGLGVSLGGSWGISLGVIACIGCGVYELGRHNGPASDA